MMIVIGKQVSSAAVNLLKFVSPPSSATAAATGGTQDASGGVTYSEVLRSLYTHGIIYHLGDDWHRSNICRSWGSHYWRLRICALQVWWFLTTLCSIIHRSMHLHLQLFFRSTRSNVFSYAVQDENFASSATSLAQVYSLELCTLYHFCCFSKMWNIFDLKIIPSKAHHHSWNPDIIAISTSC